MPNRPVTRSFTSDWVNLCSYLTEVRNMRVAAMVPTEQVTDVRCDVCGASTRSKTGDLEYGVLQAHWGYGSVRHDG